MGYGVLGMESATWLHNVSIAQRDKRHLRQLSMDKEH